MFTGITRGLFVVRGVEHRDGLLDYTVELSSELVEGLRVGASVSIDGVCQTVVALDGALVRFQAIGETLRLTTLSQLSAGVRVSVERSYRVGDEIGGHEVAGHVVGKATIRQRELVEDNLALKLGVPGAWMKYILPKGFIALDGSSLTVADIDPEGTFTVHLIPETRRLTRLGDKLVGDQINVELDPRTVAIVDTVERVLAQRFADLAGTAKAASKED